MSLALGEALLVASGGALSFGQLLLTLVLLSSDGGMKKALAYAAGMLMALLCVGEGALFLGARALATAEVDSGVGVTAWLSLALGVLLLGMAIRTWRLPPPEPGSRPHLFAALDAASPARMMGFGALIGLINVKNLAIFLAAIDVLIQARLPPAEGALYVLAVVAVFTSYLTVPICLSAIGGARVRPPLRALRGGLERHQRPLSLGAMTLFGAVFLARGVRLLL